MITIYAPDGSVFATCSQTCDIYVNESSLTIQMRSALSGETYPTDFTIAYLEDQSGGVHYPGGEYSYTNQKRTESAYLVAAEPSVSDDAVLNKVGLDALWEKVKQYVSEQSNPWELVWSGTLSQSTTQAVGKAATAYTEFMLNYTDGSRTYSQIVYHNKASNPATSISRATNDGTNSYIVSMNVSWTETNLVTGVARQITRTSSSTTQANTSSFQITALYAR